MFIFGQFNDRVTVLQRIIFQIEEGTATFQYRHMPGKVIGPAQQRLDFGDQYIVIKRFCDKVIPSHVHGHNLIHIIRR